jgi:hypothetical protein
MTLLTMNITPRAGAAAALISEHCHESHRGAMRYFPADAEDTFCIALFGNDGFTQRDDNHPVIDARTKAYVHNLYAGLANLLPEGAVEFGTDEEGHSWVILATFPRSDDHDNYQDEDADDDAMVDFWKNIVWEQWKSQVAFTEE